MKRLISTSNEVETIISQENPENISAFFNNAVIDTIMPQYSQYLRTECQFLWDFTVNGAKNWKGNHLIFLNGIHEIDYIRRQTIGRTINWLKSDHHIKCGTILKDNLPLYIDDKIDLNKANEHLLRETKNVLKRLNQPFTNEDNFSFTEIAKIALDEWERLWDFNEVYSFLQATIMLSENSLDGIKVTDIIRLVQALEYQYVKESIREDQL